MIHRSRALRVIAITVLLAGAGLGGWAGQRARGQRALVRAARPATPDLQGWPAELRERIAAAHRDSPGALGELASLYHANGFLAEARRCYEGLEKLPPANPRWWHAHATLLGSAGEADAALAAWNRAIALAPDYLPARRQIGDLLLKLERPVEAARAYEEILRRAPDDPYALLGLARLDVESGRWESARQRLEKVTAATNYGLGYDLIVAVYEHFGEEAAAAGVRGRTRASGAFRSPPDPWIDELTELCFDAYRLSLAAGIALGSGGGAAAARWLSRAIAISPEDVTLRFQLAGVFAERGEAGRAREELERCTALAPDFPDAWAHLAAWHERAGDGRTAADVLARGLRHCPQSPGLHLMHARKLRDAGRTNEAIAAFRASIRYRPNEADAYLELATTLFRLERVAEGVAELQAALDAEPDQPTALSLLALHAISNGDETEARRWLQRVARQPRVPAAQAEELRAAFRQRFGRAYR